MPKTINLYIVYTTDLVNRINNINNVVDILKKLC